MKKYFLHGMGGSPKDWNQVLAHCEGEALALTQTQNLESTIEEIIHKVSTPDSTICGYSMGGRLAILATEKLLQLGRPPKKLILVSTGLGFSDEVQRAARDLADKNWAQQLRANAAEFWRAWYAQELFSSFHSLPQGQRETWMKDRFSININGLAAQLEALGPSKHKYLRPLLTEFLQRGISVLYIAGELDKKYLSEAKSLNEITVKVIPKAGHILPLEAPNALAELIKNF